MTGAAAVAQLWGALSRGLRLDDGFVWLYELLSGSLECAVLPEAAESSADVAGALLRMLPRADVTARASPLLSALRVLARTCGGEGGAARRSRLALPRFDELWAKEHSARCTWWRS